MEDVVLHYKRGAGELKSLVERTERALESFPCRVPPAFAPWFPSGRDRWLPIRPSKPPPVITLAITPEVFEKAPINSDSSGSSKNVTCSRAEILRDLNPTSLPGGPAPNTQNETTRLSPENKRQKHKDGFPITDVRPDPNTEAETKLSLEDKLQTHKDGLLVTGREVRRSWSVFAQKGVVAQNGQSLSKQFHKIVWSHRLHLQQRARWVICEQNCGTAGTIEQVWRELNRAIRSSKLPTCNANIQRDMAQIWVFCDVLYCEYVGKCLKEELGLTGKITLSVNKLGEIFSF